jgi:hypothetical protein
MQDNEEAAAAPVNLFHAISGSATEDQTKLLKAALEIAWDVTRQGEEADAQFAGAFTPHQAALILAYKDGHVVHGASRSFGITRGSVTTTTSISWTSPHTP